MVTSKPKAVNLPLTVAKDTFSQLNCDFLHWGN